MQNNLHDFFLVEDRKSALIGILSDQMSLIPQLQFAIDSSFQFPVFLFYPYRFGLIFVDISLADPERCTCFKGLF